MMRRAFSLIELLVVILIIAILAALLFPVLSQAKAGSVKVKCFTHMNQLGKAFALYLGDHDGVYPTCDNDKAKIDGRPPEPETPEQDGPPERDWTITLQPYIKNFEIFRCDKDTSLRPRDPKNPDLTREYRSSYTVNGWSEYNLSESAVTNPGQWVLLAERNNVTRGPKTWWMFYWWVWQEDVWPPAAQPDPLPKAKIDLDLTRHGDRAVWLFGDGSAVPRRFEQLWKAGAENAFWPSAR